MAWIPYVVEAGASLLGSQTQANAATNAANAQIAGQTGGLNALIAEYNNAMKQQTPYRVAGYNALNAALSMNGLPMNPSAVPDYISNPAPIGMQTPATVPYAHGSGPMGPNGLATKQSVMNALDPGNIMGKDSSSSVASNVLDPGNLFGGLKKGGPAMGGRAYKVGERGMETLVMPPGSTGYVIPHGQTERMMRKNNLPGRYSGGMVGEGSEDSGMQRASGNGTYMGRMPGSSVIAPQYQTPAPATPMTPLGPVQTTPAPTTPTSTLPSSGFDPSVGGIDPATGNYKPPENPGGEAGGYNFRTDPGYNFAYDEGLRGVANNDAANGLLHSTAYLKDATQYGQGMADNQFNTIYQRIAGIAGLGQTGTQAGTAAGTSLAGSIGNTYGNIGNAGASGYLNAGNANANNLNNLAALYYMYNQNNGGGGMFGGGMQSQNSSSAAPSDRRLKTDITRIGSTDNGLPLYSFRYKGDDPKYYIGPMADEVRKIQPEAVFRADDGYDRVHYGMLR